MHLLPHKISRPQYFTIRTILVNVTSHPALHNLTKEIKEYEAGPGKMYASLAALARVCGLSLHEWVLNTWAPFRSDLLIGHLVGGMSEVEVSATRKLLGAPESAMTHSLMFFQLKSMV